ncbi:hypothetical protein CTKA_00007 [Chthonomonas calidirosea]|uniref:DUF2325 domain-containing protein n=1 Tax=Chthonomonas calidirosea (strain DSM 23976 / ICMP 18418 / T49) TaxID=1303518 RepID=S0ETS5_CHTCT|nr:hypothetical protein [Chthonomonas calidirosea]CCW34971.1 hypothetical protein CCALI_01152 [Chthonomonas calidirosea T49]CEK13271.1 hypothetical protein CTKA_00007 [Chthonomonas calidirosea]
MSDFDVEFQEPSLAVATARTPEPQDASEPTTPSPLRTPEAFEAYCAQVQSRLAQYAQQRANFLLSAHDRLTRLLATARAVEDNDLYNELLQYQMATKELLDALSQVTDGAALSALPHTPKPYSLPSEQGNNLFRERAEFSPRPFTPLARTEGRPASSAFVAARVPRHPSRPLIEIEAEAAQMREDLKVWKERFPLQKENGELNIPNVMRLRAMAFRMRKLEEEAGDTEVTEVTELRKEIQQLLEEAGDKEYCVAFDYDLEPRPLPNQWAELAERQEETARAQEAYEWWMAHNHQLTVSDLQPLAEAVAATQQKFNRMLFRVGARDPYQQILFDNLRAWARESQCYLFSLRPRVPMAELVDKASRLESAWEQARIPVEAATRRAAVVDNLVALVSDPNFGSDPEQDEAQLHEALLRCQSIGVSALDQRLRDALAPWVSFLESDPRLREVLREASMEWDRRINSDYEESTLNSAQELSAEELEAVRAETRGKRLTLIGGLPREENRRQIQEALELAELNWPEMRPSTLLSHFEHDIQQTDIVALSLRYSRKEWRGVADICAREGKRFVLLPNGFGLVDLVKALQNQPPKPVNVTTVRRRTTRTASDSE